jgi:hypothetical protein
LVAVEVVVRDNVVVIDGTAAPGVHPLVIEALASPVGTGPALPVP